MTEEKIKQEINRAINMLSQNKLSEAEVICHQILTQESNADAYHILSSIKIYKREFEDSINLAKKSISLDDSNAGYFTTLGCAYSASNNYSDAIDAFNNAIKIDNKIAPVHFYQGEAYRKLKKYNDAISCFYSAINISEDYVAAHMLLGIVYQEKKQFELAIKSLEKCVEIMPDYPDAHLNLAMCYLLTGNYPSGWQEYEWRKKITSDIVNLNGDEWSGQNLDDKKLLILYEGSYPDLLQFITLARELKKDGCKLIIQSDKFFAPLLERQDWIDGVVIASNDCEYDYFIHVGSLPYLLNYDPNKNPYDTPYLIIDKKDYKFFSDEKNNIGLICQSDEKSKSHGDDSISLDYFKDTFNDKHNIILFDKLENNKLPEFINHNYLYSDAADLAQIINSLDIVVTVNHFIAHLSGALNKTTYLLLPYVPNWRWEISHRNTTPWYKSVKIFRQDFPDDWKSVIIKLKEELDSNE